MSNIAASFFNRARSHPAAPAISFGAHTITFGALGERVRRIAGSMRARAGLQRGDRVVLWMENRAEFLELLLATWTAGLCAVPVNAKLHPRELAHIAGDCGARAVFTSDALIEGIAAELRQIDPAPFVCVAGSAAYEALADGPPMACAEVAPTDLAWIFYTSGTTGKPKGAMLSHRNLLFMTFAYHADIERVEPGDTKLHAAPLSHGSGLYGLPHLFAGGHQVVLGGFEPQEVLEAFGRHPNVTMFAAPTMITRLVQAVGPGFDPGGLRTLYYGGGPMYVSDLVKALDRFGPRLYQLYGQGETPMTITGLSKRDHVGDGGPAHLQRLGSCGTPRTGVEVRVVDDAGRDLPYGEPGEVITRSDCVMAGYWNNPAATASALRDGWLWTGDIGAMDARGCLTLRDRSKDMIISGGTNIYPREIEEALLLHPAVLECSVVGRPHPDWGEEAIAFVVLRPGATAGPADLDAVCLENIARFKRPKGYRFVAALPKNNYGKILKTDLRQTLQQENDHA
ncbi:MAG TPA: long-chain fatty acid--CoA ligase [Quisquiliibacterium sp.]|nr:long-chain fatty acid--CoA ligase [Quisquiliibacterium sp.]